MGLQLLVNDVLLATKGVTVTASTDSADYPAANLLAPARGTVFQITGTVPATVDVDFNLGATLGATFAVSGVAAMNVRGSGPSGYEPTIDVYKSSTPTFSGGPLATIPGYSSFANARNRIVPLASGHIAQYWRFRITTNGYAFSIGKTMLGALYDLGYFWSPSSRIATVDPSEELRTMDKTAISVTTGEVRREYDLLFEEVGDGDRQIWEAVIEARVPFGMIEALGRHVHARIGAARRLEASHQFGIDPSLWTFTVPIEELP